MDKLVIASTHKNAGKTTMIVGIAHALGKKMGYMKPFGDRLLYQKKRLWDYDAALITKLFNLEESPEEMSIGFKHDKLRYMYDEKGIKENLQDMANKIGKGKDILFVESGRSLTYGISVNLNALSVAKYIDGKLIIVVSGDESAIMDDVTIIKKYADLSGVDFKGIIINQVKDVNDFKDMYIEKIKEMKIPVLGIVPYKTELAYFSVEYLADALFAKVVAGERGTGNIVKHVLVGAMSANVAMNLPRFREENKVIITGGDRSDMILAALETNSSAVILTGNLLPPANIISKAEEKNIPLLSVPMDTYETARRIENTEALLTRNDKDKIELIKKLVKDNVNIKSIL